VRLQLQSSITTWLFHFIYDTGRGMHRHSIHKNQHYSMTGISSCTAEEAEKQLADAGDFRQLPPCSNAPHTAGIKWNFYKKIFH